MVTGNVCRQLSSLVKKLQITICAVELSIDNGQMVRCEWLVLV